jgi:hypothetical protein
VDNIIDHEEFSLYDQGDPEGSSVTTLTLTISDIEASQSSNSSSTNPVVYPIDPGNGSGVDPSTL